jgi:K+-transporting ATPase KdpF subunit
LPIFAFAIRREAAVTTPLILAGLTALGLLVYLIAVLVRPERF